MTRKVLWIDDQPAQVFISRAFVKYGILITVKECYTDGITWLSSHLDTYDAVILDVNCKITREQTEAPSMDVFRDYAHKVFALCENPKFIPWFVYTGGGYDGEESLNRVIPKTEWAKKQYYDKPSDREILLSDIIELTEQADNVTIRNKYKDAFSICDAEMDELLLSIAKSIEGGDVTDASIFNDMRKLLAKSIPYCKNHGLFPEEIVTSKQGKKFIVAINTSSPIENVAPAEIVPSYISWNYSAVEDCVNNGSHTEEEANPENPNLLVDTDVTRGLAPFLGRLTFYQLLTLFTWMSHLPQSIDEQEALREKISSLNIAIEKKNESNIANSTSTSQETPLSTGIVEFDGYSYHCGIYLLPKSIEPNIGKKIAIWQVVENTKAYTKDKYPLFCQKYKIQ